MPGKFNVVFVQDMTLEQLKEAYATTSELWTENQALKVELATMKRNFKELCKYAGGVK